jgi:hypothetical protein
MDRSWDQSGTCQLTYAEYRVGLQHRLIPRPIIVGANDGANERGTHVTRRRNCFRYSYFVPFVLWSSLAARTAETMLASAHVVGYRMRRMALCGASPSARDRREFALMGREKAEAGAQSAWAMGSHMLNGNQLLWTRAFSNMLRSTSALMLLASSRTPAQWITRQMAVAREFGNAGASMANVSRSATRLAHRGLKPIHAKATANARRLGRRA